MRKVQHGIGVVVCGVALFAAGVALADNPGHHNGNGTTSTTTSNAASPNTASTSTTTTLPSQAKGYGFYCQNQSKKHVADQKGTPFSQCVTAMAHLASGDTDSPKAACAKLSKQHVAGQKGTPYSACVSAGAKLLNNNS